MTETPAPETPAASPAPFDSNDALAGHYADDAPDVSVTTAPPESVWDPLGHKPPKIHTLAVAKVHGVEMTITLRPWTAAHRLTYEDLTPTLQMAVPDQLDDDGDALQVMKLGSLKQFGAALTVIGSSGFKQTPDGRPFLVGTLEQRRADLSTITDPALYEEIIETALNFEPLPGSTRDKKRLADAKTGVQDGDPSPTPSTPQTTASSGTPTSPDA
jgi:hypothetical protein